MSSDTQNISFQKTVPVFMVTFNGVLLLPSLFLSTAFRYLCSHGAPLNVDQPKSYEQVSRIVKDKGEYYFRNSVGNVYLLKKHSLYK